MMRRSLTTLAGLALALAACAGQSMMVGGDSVRQPNPPPKAFEILVLDGDDLTPLPARLDLGDLSLQANADGKASTTWQEEWSETPVALTVSIPGFVTELIEVAAFPDDASIEVRLAPVRLSGKVLAPDGRGLPLVTVTLGDVELQTDARGGFTFVRAEPGRLSLRRPRVADDVPDLGWQVHRVGAFDGAAANKGAAGRRKRGRRPRRLDGTAPPCSRLGYQCVRGGHEGWSGEECCTTRPCRLLTRSVRSSRPTTSIRSSWTWMRSASTRSHES